MSFKFPEDLQEPDETQEPVDFDLIYFSPIAAIASLVIFIIVVVALIGYFFG